MNSYMLKNIFDEISSIDNNFEILSMGMSNDYNLAIEFISNNIFIVRICGHCHYASNLYIFHLIIFI